MQYVQGKWGDGAGLVNVADPKSDETVYESAFSYASDFEEERMNSYFGRLTYNFKEKYMFETTIRRDGFLFSEKKYVGQPFLRLLPVGLFRKNPS